MRFGRLMHSQITHTHAVGSHTQESLSACWVMLGEISAVFQLSMCCNMFKSQTHWWCSNYQMIPEKFWHIWSLDPNAMLTCSCVFIAALLAVWFTPTSRSQRSRPIKWATAPNWTWRAKWLYDKHWIRFFLCLKTYLWSVFSKISDGDGKERPLLLPWRRQPTWGFMDLYCIVFFFI